MPQTLRLYIAPALACASFSVLAITLSSLHLFVLSNAVRMLPWALLLSVPVTASFSIGVVGEYRASYGAQETHQQTMLEKRLAIGAMWGRRLLVGIMVAGVLSVLFLIHGGKSLPRVSEENVANAAVRPEAAYVLSPKAAVQKDRTVIDAVGTHMLPAGFQEQALRPAPFFQILGISAAVMQNPSNGTRIMLFRSKNTNAVKAPTLSGSKLRAHCTQIVWLPDEVVRYGNQSVSFQRCFCTGLESGKSVRMETEMGNLFLSAPVAQRITFTMIGLQQTWNAHLMRDLVHSFRGL